MLPSFEPRSRQEKDKPQQLPSIDQSKQTKEGALGGKKKPQKSVQQDLDPQGEALMNVDDPLAEALKYLKLIQKHSPNNIHTHLLATNIYFRKEKYLLVLQSLKRALAIDSQHPMIHKVLIELYDTINSSDVKTKIPPQVKEVFDLEAQLPLLLGGLPPNQKNQNYLTSYSHSYLHRIVVAEMMFKLDPASKTDAIKLLSDFNGLTCGLTPSNCVTAHKVIKDTFKENETANQFQEMAAKIHPFATYFAPNKSTSIYDTFPSIPVNDSETTSSSSSDDH